MANTNNTSEIRQADNKLTIEGIVNEVKLEIKTIKSAKGEKEAITGEIDIKTGEGSIHPINVFSYKYKDDGSDNGIFKGLNTIKEEYKSITADGEANADRVRITQGQLGVNEYYQNDQLRTFAKFSANFINRLKDNEALSPKAEFEVETYIYGKMMETDKEGIESGRLKLKGYVGVYGGKVIPIDFIVSDAKAVQYVDDNYNVGDTVRIYGDIVNTLILTEVEKPVEFGKPRKEIQRTTVRELVVTGGSAPYDEEDPKKYSVEAIKNAVAERNLYLEEMKKKKENNASASSSTSNTSKSSGGFNTKSAPKNDTVDDDELPF